MDKYDLAEHKKGFTPVGIRKNVNETGTLYHGTKANLNLGDLLETGYASKYSITGEMALIFLTG